MSFQKRALNFLVESDNDAVGDAVHQWLTGLRIDPPVPLTFSLTIAQDPEPYDDPRPPFHQPAVEIRSGPPTDVLAVSWKIASAHARMNPEANRIDVVLSPEAVERLHDLINTFLITVLILALRRLGWHHLHAACARDPRGRGWLIAGNARAGKSTTAALMASQGWHVGSDDTTFITGEGSSVTARATYQPLALRRGGKSFLGDIVPSDRSRRGKYLCWPEQLGGHWIDRIEPEILLFSTPGQHVTTCTPIRPMEALAELIRWSAWVVLEPSLAQSHLDLLNRLAEQTRGYRAELGSDLFRDPTRLSKLVA